MKFSAQTDNSTVPNEKGARRTIVARIEAPPAPDQAPRPRADISLVLDRSGSMAGEKFHLAREAVSQAITHLSSSDTFSVVVYDDRIKVVQPATEATGEAKRQAMHGLRQIGPRGATNLSEGWLTGCGQVAERLTDDRIGRCLLLTDGLANDGITSPEALVKHATELRNRGVSTSTFGVGADFDEVLLGQMADAGGGAFTFCETADQIPEFIKRELGETLEIVARQVVIDVDAPVHVKVEPIGVFPVERTETGMRILLPDLVSEQELEVPMWVSLPSGAEGTEVKINVRLSDRDNVFGRPQSAITWTLTDAATSDTAPVDTELQAIVAERLVAIAQEQAAALNRDGRYDEALWRLEEERVCLMTAFESTEAIAKLEMSLRRAARVLRYEMDPIERKRMHYSSISVRSGGTDAGYYRKRRSRS